MDLWIVAAATGAGYIAKHWQQNLLSREKGDSSDSLKSATRGQHQFVNVFQQIREQTDPLRQLSNRRADRLDDLLGKNFQELIRYPLDDDRQRGDAITGSCYDYKNVLPLDRLQQSAATEDKHHLEFWGSSDRKPEFGDRYCSRLNRNYRHSKMMPHLFSLQQFDPLIPTESFLANQFYNRRSEIEKDDAFSLYHLPRESALRPLLVTDGINRTSSDTEMVEMKNREGLPKTIGANLPMRSVQNADRVSSTNPSISGDRTPDRLMNSPGSSNGELFFLGLTTGMMSSIIASRRQVGRLSEKLKQAKSLVKDLQEEVEMKDQLTIKEIDWKASSSGESSGTTNEMPKGRSSSHCDQHETKPDMERSEAMSKIEAELEAELERLELNMRTTSLDDISEFVELDPDLEIDIVCEDPNLEKLDAQQLGASSNSDRDDSKASDDLPQAPNFAVSPRELTLRLHEVIESRLGARIVELEAALEGTQRRLSTLPRSTRMGSTSELDGPWNRASLSMIMRAMDRASLPCEPVTSPSPSRENPAIIAELREVFYP